MNDSTIEKKGKFNEYKFKNSVINKKKVPIKAQRKQNRDKKKMLKSKGTEYSARLLSRKQRSKKRSNDSVNIGTKLVNEKIRKVKEQQKKDEAIAKEKTEEKEKTTPKEMQLD
eukprot:CAMPEP_0197004154 /NCGR_PEP_ID=MMETSP1380-20130617/19419_1 /TAXON_ID=5936 /ORGANISM="Euplotes crassus, Strain CT5" /LENGTH=112 /DNA_ID=CAMNT_0042422851 /DNA_START=43 /DNA_END=381 /DNA_ORIENTATION=+